MNSVELLITGNLWLSLAVAVPIAVLDYVLTIYNARTFRAAELDAKLRIEGSLEITPFFQTPVNQLQLINARFLLILALRIVLLVAVWYWAAFIGAAFLYALFLGATVVGPFLAIIRHIENAIWYRALQRLGPDDVFRSEQPRWLRIQSSAVNRLMYAVLFAATFVLTGSFFLLGGACSCAGNAFQRWRISRWERKKKVA